MSLPDARHKPVEKQADPLAARLFVDSGAGFGYSELLARCCAWGLCGGVPIEGSSSNGVFELTRTRLVDAL